MKNILKSPEEYIEFINSQKLHDFQLEECPTSTKFTIEELCIFLSHYPKDSEILVHDILKGTSYLVTGLTGCINPEDINKHEDDKPVRYMPALIINHDYEFAMNLGANNFYELYGLISAITGTDVKEVMTKITSHEAFIEFINQIRQKSNEKLDYLIDVWNKYDPYSKKNYVPAARDKDNQE